MNRSSKKMVSESRKVKSRKNLIKKISNRVKRVSRKLRRNVKKMGRKLNKRKRNKSKSKRRTRKMRGGAIEYSPLPCDANGNTDWNSTQQVGHETCVEYGIDGAENDARASGLNANLSSKKINETIKDTVYKTIKDMSPNDIEQLLRSTGGSTGNTAPVQKAYDPKMSQKASEIEQERLAAQNQTTAVSQ